jgi:PAS domain S-box-containing protein
MQAGALRARRAASAKRHRDRFEHIGGVFHGMNRHTTERKRGLLAPREPVTGGVPAGRASPRAPDAARAPEQPRDQRRLSERRKRTAADRARDRMFAILDSATALVAMADHSGALIYLNRTGRNLLGLAQDEDVSSKMLIECIAPEVRPPIAEHAIPAAMRDGVWSGDSALVARDGRGIEVSLMITAHFAADGRSEGVSLVAQDISEWVRSEEALRITQNELLRLSAQHLSIQEAERQRIAADLHDALGQSLSLVSVSMERVSSLLGTGQPALAAESLDLLKPKLKEVVEEVRRIAMNLRPSTLDSLGILATLSWYFREFQAACPGVQLVREFDVEESEVPAFLKTPIFRILQEASSNAIKHARADRISVRLRKERAALELSIEDDGRGFDPAAIAAQPELTMGVGLQNMRERALLSCGIFELVSEPGKGTRICVRWPLSMRELELDRAAALAPDLAAARALAGGEFESARDSAMLHKLSVCVACIRSINGNG